MLPPKVACNNATGGGFMFKLVGLVVGDASLADPALMRQLGLRQVLWAASFLRIVNDRSFAK